MKRHTAIITYVGIGTEADMVGKALGDSKIFVQGERRYFGSDGMVTHHTRNGLLRAQSGGAVFGSGMLSDLLNNRTYRPGSITMEEREQGWELHWALYDAIIDFIAPDTIAADVLAAERRKSNRAEYVFFNVRFEEI